MKLSGIDFIFRHGGLFMIAMIAVILLRGRLRARPLIETGCITEGEANAFVWTAFALLGSAFGGAWLAQLLLNDQGPLCPWMFPPRSTAGTVLWVIQGTLSVTVIWWLWLRDGARLLAGIAPAFMSGPVLDRRLSPRRARLFVSALLVLAPLGNMVMQMSGVGPDLCEITLPGGAR